MENKPRLIIATDIIGGVETYDEVPTRLALIWEALVKAYIERFTLIVKSGVFRNFVMQAKEVESTTPSIESTAALRGLNFELSEKKSELEDENGRLAAEKQGLIREHNQLLSELESLSKIAETGVAKTPFALKMGAGFSALGRIKSDGKRYLSEHSSIEETGES